MLNINELRIGNYVIHNVQDYKYTKKWTCADFALCVTGLIKPKNLHGIRFNENILLQCGFKKEYAHKKNTSTLKSDIRYVITSENLYVYVNADILDKVYYMYNDERMELQRKHTVKYLHQLQNLYYAVNQKELSVQIQIDK